MTLWKGDSLSTDNTLTNADLEEIADQAASSLEESLSKIVFWDEETGEAYHYSPSSENHDHFAALCKEFLASRFDTD
jgi:hypothetical protein